MIRKLLTFFLFFLILFFLAGKQGASAYYCTRGSPPPEGYFNNNCQGPGCQSPWTTWCDANTYNPCASKGDQASCQAVYGGNCGGWGRCYWCSGIYGSCTAWSPVCGSQTRTCYDTACGLPQTQSQAGPNCINGGPTVSINSVLVTPNNSSQYTISMSASDMKGWNYIGGEYALINYQGENGGLYRGYLTWGNANYWPSAQENQACAGGGYAAVQGGYGNTYIHLRSCNIGAIGSTLYVNFVVTIDTSYTTPIFDNDISAYAWDVAGTANGWINYQTNFNLNMPPVLSSVAINHSPIVANNSTQYAITTQLSDINGASDIYQILNIINYQGPRAGTYRGYISWGISNWWPSSQDNRACTGGGYAAIQAGYGNTYIHLDACTIVDNGNNKTLTATVRFDPTFATDGPTTLNDISGLIYDSAWQSNSGGWVDFPTAFSVCGPTTTISGTVSSIPAGNTSTVYAGASYSSAAIPAPSGNYTITVPSSTAYSGYGQIPTNYSVYASQITNYSASPGYISVPVSCSPVVGPNFSYATNVCTQPDTSLVAVYHMDETPVGGVGVSPVLDSSGNNYNGTSTGTTIIAGGQYGNARSFNGTTDNIAVSPVSALNFTTNGNFTISIWANPNTLGSTWRRAILSAETYLASGYRFGFDNGGAPRFWTDQSGGTLSVVSSDPMILNQWNNIIVVYNSGQATIYLNGQPKGTATGTYVAGSNPTNIGSIGGMQYFSGALDELRVWNRALTPAEVGGEASQQCPTQIYTNCGAYGTCNVPGGVCGTGTKSRTCYDSGNGTPHADNPVACAIQPSQTISGQVMNAPYAVTVNGVNTYTPAGGTCPATITSSPTSQTSYAVSSPALCGYNLDLQAITGYSTSPINYPATFGCSSVTGPTFWYLSNAGVVGSQGTINSGAGKISQGGLDPGYRLNNYINSADATNINYTSLLGMVLKNSGYYTAAALDADLNCSGGGTVSTPNFNIYCYTASTIDTKLSAAIAAGTSTKTMVLYPKGNSNLDQTLAAAQTITANGQIVVVLVNGNLNINSNITIPAALNGSGIVFAVNGNVSVNPAVANLDGFYVFTGSFDDGVSQTALSGRGSLISTAGNNILFNRIPAVNTVPAETWFYEPKYIILYQQSLASTKYSWQELSPQ